MPNRSLQVKFDRAKRDRVIAGIIQSEKFALAHPTSKAVPAYDPAMVRKVGTDPIAASNADDEIVHVDYRRAPRRAPKSGLVLAMVDFAPMLIKRAK